MASDVAFNGSTNIYTLLNDDSGPLADDGISRQEDASNGDVELIGSNASPLLRSGESTQHIPVTSSKAQQRLSNICFLIIGVGVAIAWTACRAGIAYFSVRFASGSSFYTYMQVAYNVPILPLLIAQTLFDNKFDEKYGSARTFRFRLVVSMLAMAACVASIPYGNQTSCLVAVCLVGVLDGVAYGTASQLFSMFPAAVSGYYFIGSSLTSVICIALTFATGFDTDPPTFLSAQLMYWIAALIVLLGLAAALVLLHSPQGRHYLHEKDEQSRRRRRKEDAKAVNLANATTNSSKDLRLYEEDASTESDGADAASVLNNFGLFKLTFWCHACLFFCWLGTNMVDSLIAFVPSEDDTPTSSSKNFRLIVLYASLLGELAGKQLNIARRGRVIKTSVTLFYFVAARFLLSLPFLLYVLQPLFTVDGKYHVRIDGLYVTYQALFDMSGAYFSSLTYSFAPALLPHALLRPQASSLLAITLMFGVYGGLGGSVGLSQLLSAVPASSLS